MNTIDRRTLLKGIGTAMALPMLERMLPLTALASTPKVKVVRNAYLFVVNGVEITHWTPAADGALVLPNILEPLADVKNNLNVLTGLTQHYAFANGDGPGDHARSCACWLTGVQARKTSGADIHNGVSVDQIAAQHIGKYTKFPSLEIGCERSGLAGDCDSGYSCAYSSNISWKDDHTPNAKEINPRLVFERLFGNGDEEEQGESLARRQILKQSILDFVSEDASRLKSQLGRKDLMKMDEYFTAVREIEDRLVRFENSPTYAASQAQKPVGIPGDYGEHIRLMADMMILAFQADLTRTCTFMFANDGSNRTFAQIGVPEGHHDMSHHGGDPAKLAKKRAIDRYHIEQLAYTLKKMQSIEEAQGGTLLDNTFLMYGAGISDGNAHNHDNLPILLAGKGGTNLQTGRHIRYNDGTPLDNLYLDILDKMGVPTDHMGDSTGKLQGIL
jgi:Protein of unknown function (DUF1552)